MGQETTERLTLNPGEPLLHTLSTSLLRTRYRDSPYRLPPSQEPQLLVQQLPPDLPIEIPLPEGSRVLGSLIYGTISIVFDSTLLPAQVQDFYREHLRAAGWSIPAAPSGHVDFRTPPPAVEPLLLFCQSSRNRALQVMISEGSGARTQVHLELDFDPPEYSPCRPKPDHVMAMRGRCRRIEEILPPLWPPPNAQQVDRGGALYGGRDGEAHRYYQSIRLWTDDDLTMVAAHYMGQLEQAGWVRQSTEQHGPLIRSSWTRRDPSCQNWQGIFFVLTEAASPRQYFLHLDVQAAGEMPI